MHEELVGTDCIYIVSDGKTGRRIKTKQSARVIPIHRQLIDAGFLGFVAEQAKVLGDKAWLFPKVAPNTSGARAFSKWFGRYIGAHGVNDHVKVFHSFRHNFIDALRLAGVGEDVRRALVGHTEGGVPGGYGAKKMAARYRHRLAEAIASVAYTGLDLSHVANHRATHVHPRPPNAEGSSRGGER
jgi:integrase